MHVQAHRRRSMCYYLLSALGVTYVLKYGTILEKVRRVLGAKIPMMTELFHCALCLGFWSGAMIAPLIAYDDTFINAFLFPFASAAWCWTIDELHDAVVMWKNRD